MRIGIFGDIHEDIASLRRILQRLDACGYDHLVCLGDIVGYDVGDYGRYSSQDAEACVRLVEERCSTVVIGNHDLFAIKKVPRFTAGFHYLSDWYAMAYEERNRYHQMTLWNYCPAEEQEQLSSPVRRYLESLPEYAVVPYETGAVHFSHHLFPDLSGSRRKMPEWLPDVWHHLRWMRTHHCDLGISGHTHLRGTLTASWVHLQHTGSIHLSPGHSRRWFTCPPVTRGPVPSGFLILDTQSRRITVHLLDSIPTL